MKQRQAIAKRQSRLARDDRVWKPFGHYEGFVYKLLDVDSAKRTIDMVMRFEPRRLCFYHRHLCTVASIVLEGEHHVCEVNAAGREQLSVRGVGEFNLSHSETPHIEGGGPEGGVVYFSMRGGDSDHIYDILDDSLDLVRKVYIQDFERTLRDW